MAAGDRKVKILHLEIFRDNPVRAKANWALFVENKLGEDVQARGGDWIWSLGTPAVARAKTLQTIENEAVTQVTAAENTPPNDSVA